MPDEPAAPRPFDRDATGGRSVVVRCEPAPRRGRRRPVDFVDERRDEPVSCGLPWPAGLVDATEALVVRDRAGRALDCQVQSLERWPDGSLRWTLIDWLASTEEGTADYVVEVAEEPSATVESEPMVDRRSDGALVVDGGRCRVVFAAGDRPLREVSIDGAAALDPAATSLYAVDEAGARYAFTVERLAVEDAGRIRTSVRLDGGLVADGKRLATVVARFHVVAGSPTLRCEVTITNERPAGHPGGRWSLGSAGAVYLRDLGFRAAIAAAGDGAAGSATASASVELGDPEQPIALPWQLHQESSGGDHWDSPNHVDRHGEVPLRFRGYRVAAVGEAAAGDRATPIATLERDGRVLSIAVEHFWQNFPKALTVREEALTLHLLPEGSEGLHELQGGEQKTHRFHLALARDEVTERPLAWCLRPLIAQASPEAYAAAGAVRYLTPRSTDGNDRYLALVDLAVDGDDTFDDKREAIDEYGWRHFGDVYGDHEAAYHDGSGLFISHYNNQYDAVRGFGIQFLRGADRRWFQMMDELARHVVDIDVYHTAGDKSAYNGGQFWHTVHYIDAGSSTHRSYPPVEGVYGGGPSTGQLYTSGLMLHYFLTGDRGSRDTVLGFGRYVIDADDGAQTVFRLLDRSYTGHVSESGADRYHGPGRSPANAINALIDSHRLSGERRYLEKAEQLVRRTIHPADDLEARKLSDAELRWYYTMYLQALGKYLDWKSTLGELDAMYAYGRAALLHYVRWAAEHEYPYLDKPEILEYPTETWAAQEMRKSEVFRLACRHAEGDAERRRFRERARFFFDNAVETLATMETRSFCRPIVLLTVCGHSQAYLDRLPGERAPGPPPTPDFGRPETFVPQKVRVKRKLMLAGAAGTLLTAAGLGYLVLLLAR